jgi:hypothetical protein
MIWIWHLARTAAETRITILLGKPERDNLLDLSKEGTHNKPDLKEIKYESVKWNHLLGFGT